MCPTYCFPLFSFFFSPGHKTIHSYFALPQVLFLHSTRAIFTIKALFWIWTFCTYTCLCGSNCSIPFKMCIFMLISTGLFNAIAKFLRIHFFWGFGPKVLLFFSPIYKPPPPYSPFAVEILLFFCKVGVKMARSWSTTKEILTCYLNSRITMIGHLQLLLVYKNFIHLHRNRFIGGNFKTPLIRLPICGLWAAGSNGLISLNRHRN